MLHLKKNQPLQLDYCICEFAIIVHVQPKKESKEKVSFYSSESLSAVS